MEKSKLLDLCRAIEEEEWKHLLDFVDSPFFNKNKQLGRLCRLLWQSSKKGFPSSQLLASKVWQKLYPGTTFQSRELAYLMSDLLKLGEQFLGQQQLQGSALHKDLHILRALASRKLDKSYRLKRNQIQQQLNASARNDQDHFQLKIELSAIENQHFNQQNQRVFNPHLKTQNEELDQYYQISKRSLFCDMLNQKRVLGSEYTLSWPASPFTKTSTDSPNDVQRIYQSLFELLNNPNTDDAQFQQYNASLAALNQQVNPNELIRLYYFSINYCLYEINRGNRQYATALLDLYQQGLKNENLLTNGELSPWIFKNMVKLGLGLQQFPWVQNIIENYSNKLPANQQKDAFAFNMADLAYHQKDYDQALHLLNQVDFKDPFYKHGAKAMLLKIYYEKQESDAFYALATSYRIMLLRDQSLSETAKAALANFNKLITKLYDLRPRDEKAIQQFEKKLQRSKHISDKLWLTRQLQLKAKR